MGTNYYYLPSDYCPTCGAPRGEERHIGKSSGGWCFALHVYPDEGIHDLQDWEERWREGGTIRDEYGRGIPRGEMINIIRVRGNMPEGRPPTLTWDWMDVNHAAPGPNGLVRHRVEGNCIGHGAGTWDLLVGEFS